MTEETNKLKWKEQSLIQRRSTMEDLVKRNMEVLSKALPEHITVDNLIGTFLTSVARTPKLLECTQTSILGSLWTSAKLGLSCDGLLGEGYLLPFYNKKEKRLECQFLTGYRGFVKLAYQSDFIKTFEARCVYENDEFTYHYGLHADIVHVPTPAVKGNLTHAYTVVHFKNGGYIFSVMTKEEIDTIRLLSPNADGNAWKNHYDEMAKKTVSRQQIKMIPMSTERLTRAASLDEKVEVLQESQKNELNLVDYDISGDFNEELKESLETTEADTLPSEAKSKAELVAQSAMNQVKKANGNGNGNGKHKDDSVAEELRKAIQTGEADLADAAIAGDNAKVKTLQASLAKLKSEYKELTGKDFS